MKIPSRPTLAGSCRHALLLCLALFTAGAAAATSPADLDQHQSGTKYSPLSQINTGNVGNLELAWEYHTGETPPKDLKRSEEHTSELQSLMRISYAVFCLKKKKHVNARQQIHP